MARLPYPDEANLDDATRTMLAALGRPMNIFRMLAHAPATLKGVQVLGSAVLGRQSLSAKLRELAILRVAQRSSAAYEWAQHVPIAHACGVTQDQVEALERGDAVASCFDGIERSVLAASDELVTGARLSDRVLGCLQQTLPPAQIVELVVAIGFYMLVARFLETTGVELESEGVPDAGSVDPRLTGRR